MRIKLLVLIVMLMSAGLAGARNVQAELKFQPDTVTIGGRILFTVKVTAPLSENIVFPDEAFYNEFEFTSFDEDIKESKDKIIIQRTYTLLCFEEGTYVISSIPLFINNQLDSVTTNPITIVVTSPNIPDDFVPFDIKGPVNFKISWWHILLIVFLILAVVGVVIFVIAKKLGGKSGYFGNNIKAKPPYDEAIERLDKLKKAKLIESDRYKDYYSELTDIIRNYISRLSNYSLMEKTTAEILEWMPQSEFKNDDLIQKIKTLFECADYVKFAKHLPTQFENGISLQNAQSFVELTKPAEPSSDNKTEADESV